MPTLSEHSFQYIQEESDAFLALFPYRYDYIWAEHPEPRGKVEWKTESRHPLSDRLLQQGGYLYGVRFGAETQYCLIDIDTDSVYHPKHDPFAITRILGAIEPLGLVSFVACTSSYSGGIHLYFPLDQAQKTWELALVLRTALEMAGLKPTLGQLELFPNVRLFTTEGIPSFYAAHRLPMQAGSYILNRDWAITHSEQSTFVQQWHLAQHRNQVDARTLKRLLQRANRQRFTLSGKADKFLNDLNTEIEPGWTGLGQTNYILGRIAMRSYIFGHLLYGSEPLTGIALVKDIVRVAQALPGYYEWCRHQYEIEHRAAEWAACVENSDYFPFGQSKQCKRSQATLEQGNLAEQPQSLTWNQQRSQTTRERIRHAIVDLLNQNILPATATARFHALTHYGIGGGSLYRHRDLWHPSHLEISTAENNCVEHDCAVENLPVENLPVENFESSVEQISMDCVQDASIEIQFQSLFSQNDGNTPSRHSFKPDTWTHPASVDGNSLNHRETSDRTVETTAEITVNEITVKQTGIQYVKNILLEIQLRQRDRAVQPIPVDQTHSLPPGFRPAHIQRMQDYWNSGDPILMAEAQHWDRRNPGLLRLEPVGRTENRRSGS